jgi:adenine-specific DNA methylase
MSGFSKRLIEVDLPIKRISAHARREKSIRHGHISTLHIWWARRPLAACRAVICAALWPDPVDVTEEDVRKARQQGADRLPNTCPPAFREAAAKIIHEFARAVLADNELATAHCSPENFTRWTALVPRGFDPDTPAGQLELRVALLDFIADFANWDNSTTPAYLKASRALTQSAHEALGGIPGTRPLVVDPFCGGGSIPLEALRVGADAFASDLNPVAVLFNKVVLEYIPKYGQRLADEVRKWGDWIKQEAKNELAEFYPKDKDGATPIAYLWARTIRCEGPGCGAEVPLIRSIWLAKKSNRSVALQLVPRPRAKRADFQIIVKKSGKWTDQANPKAEIPNPKFEGTVARGSATCPCCGYTTPIGRVREQLKAHRGGANHARLMCVVSTRANEAGRFYRQPTDADFKAVRKAEEALEQKIKTHSGPVSLLPDEKLDVRGIRHTWGMIYGQESWTDHFTRRQLLALTTITRLLQGIEKPANGDAAFYAAVATCLALNVGKLADLANSLCPWEPVAECPRHLFSRQAVPFTWDFGEGVPTGDSSGSWQVMIERFATILAGIGSDWHQSSPHLASATAHPLPDDSANAIVTDPPYYDAVPYAYLSDFFYVWLRRSLVNVHPDLFRGEVVPKDSEIVVDRPHELSNSTHDIAFYERELTKAFSEGRRVLRPDGVGTVVFASKTTASWEAILKAVVDAGWIITGSWPIDTEMETRVSAQGQARLASSVHLVCRPRVNPDSSVRTDEIGDWRDVLQELPRRIHEWMPRLAEEGVVGADAIFACLGPALEIFSRYSRVEKASGDTVLLKEYLEHVWAAVAKEALTMIFTGADATGFEEDARLTAMWLWTLKTDEQDSAVKGQEAEDTEDDDEGAAKKGGGGGFVLEFDAARKIAQGLGAHLEDLASLVAVEGETARLLPVAERARTLFGKDKGKAATTRRKREPQMDLFKVFQPDTDTPASFGDTKVESLGHTVLDRVHQSMILFAASRGEALKRFLVEDGAGNDQRFWRLAQALSALYPASTDEKRWVDGVLARKKGFGF